MFFFLQVLFSFTKCSQLWLLQQRVNRIYSPDTSLTNRTSSSVSHLANPNRISPTVAFLAGFISSLVTHLANRISLLVTHLDKSMSSLIIIVCNGKLSCSLDFFSSQKYVIGGSRKNFSNSWYLNGFWFGLRPVSQLNRLQWFPETIQYYQLWLTFPFYLL